MFFLQRTLCIFLGVLAVGMAQTSYADDAKDVASSKERLVLMPLRVDMADVKMQGNFEIALIEGLSQKYDVFAGEKVRQKVKEIFSRESSAANEEKRVCDQVQCLQNIASAFQSELIATANVSRDSNGYVLTLSITNIFDEKSIYSKSLPCPGCGNFQVIKKLKEITGMVMKEDVKHYYWSVGVNVMKYTDGTGTDLHLDYDMSNLLSSPIFLRVGLNNSTMTRSVDSIGTSNLGLVNVTNTITDKVILTYLSANYVFMADNEYWHPFAGFGLGMKKITEDCSSTGGGCLSESKSLAVGLANFGLQYNLNPSFNIELSVLIQSKTGYGPSEQNTLAGSGVGLNIKF